MNKKCIFNFLCGFSSLFTIALKLKKTKSSKNVPDGLIKDLYKIESDIISACKNLVDLKQNQRTNERKEEIL